MLSANIELKLDEVSEFIADYKLQEHFTTTIANYFKLLKPKSNQKKLANILDPEHFSEDILKTGLISILLQNEPVSNELKSLDMVMGLFNDNGELISNEMESSCNATSINPKERVFEVILTLDTLGAKASFCYLKAYNPKDKLNPMLNDLITISTLMGMDF